MTKRVAWFTGEPSVKECFTPHKVYDVFNEDDDSFNLKDDTGDTRLCLKEQCAHICHGDWVFADVVDEEKKVEEVKRKGVMTLLPEDSKFEIGQRVRVDRSGYIGYTTIIGYNYDYDEYATECDKDNGCSHDCEGLAKKKGKGLWIAEDDIIGGEEAPLGYAVRQEFDNSRSSFIAGKKYKILFVNEKGTLFHIKSESGNICSCLFEGCAHLLNGENWKIVGKDWQEDEKETKTEVVEQTGTKPKKPKKWSKWIENTTGKCPEGLKRKQKIKLKWADGDKFVIDNPHDEAWYFSQGNNPVDITHYKVKLDTQPKLKEKKGWTKNTGVCPVDGKVKVEIKMKNGDKECALAKHFLWILDDEEWDIIKWRLAD